jgi:nucleoside-diphosphate kinase
MAKQELEQTLVLLKPDVLRNSLTGYVLSLISEYHTGLRFAGAKVVHVSRMLAAEHYAEHRQKPFFGFLLDYIMGCIHYADEPQKRRVMAFVFQGPAAVEKMREVAGPTNPHVARVKKPGCIRALGTTAPIRDTAGNIVGEQMENLIHTSANGNDAEREIKLWFKPNDIPPFMHAYPTEICTVHYYLKDGELYKGYEPGTTCLLAPGDVAWSSDLEALRQLIQDLPASVSLDAVAVKYLINGQQEN